MVTNAINRYEKLFSFVIIGFINSIISKDISIYISVKRKNIIIQDIV